MKQTVATLLLACFLLSACVPASTPDVLSFPTPAASLTTTPEPSPSRAPSAFTTPHPQAPSYVKIMPGPIDASAFLPIELEIQTDGVYSNPYDPAVVNLQMRFTHSNGQTVLVPAFWTQEYDPITNLPVDAPGWRARFTPTLPGLWTAQAFFETPDLQSDAFSFSVAPNDQATGFIRVNPANKLYFAYDNGETFFPVGLNIGWDGDQVLTEYQRWMDRLSAQGGTVMRVWMASWSFGLEWNDTPLGDYTARLHNAWLLDQIFDLAEQRGIKIILVLINHGMFSKSTNPQWNENPLNTANGGPLRQPEEFTTNPEARRLFTQRLRYTAARWAYSPSLLAWEWWNEEDLTSISTDQLISWIQEMTPILHAYDPYHHLITTSFASSSVPEVANLPEIDFAELHRYDFTDPGQTFPSLYRQLRAQIHDKPILFGEFGNSASIEDINSPDQYGLHLHTSLWAATFSGFASTAMYWWWDTYVDPLTLWPVYGRLTRYLKGEDLAKYQSASVGLSSSEVVYRVLKADGRQLIWLHDPKYDVKTIVHEITQMAYDHKTPEPGWIYLPDPVSGLSITLSGLADGQYVVYWYSPNQGQWLQNQPVTIQNGDALVQIPTFQGDLAAKVLPVDAPPPE